MIVGGLEYFQWRADGVVVEVPGLNPGWASSCAAVQKKLRKRDRALFTHSFTHAHSRSLSHANWQCDQLSFV